MEFEAKCNLAELERLAVEDLRRQGFDLAPGSQPHFNPEQGILYLPFVRLVETAATHLNITRAEAVKTGQQAILAEVQPAEKEADPRPNRQKPKDKAAKLGKKAEGSKRTKQTVFTTIEEDQAQLAALGPEVKKLAGRAKKAGLLETLSEAEQAQVREWWRIEGRLVKKVQRIKLDQTPTQATTVVREVADGEEVDHNTPQFPLETFTGSNTPTTETDSGSDGATANVQPPETTAEAKLVLPVEGTVEAVIAEQVVAEQEQETIGTEVVAATDYPFSLEFNSN